MTDITGPFNRPFRIGSRRRHAHDAPESMAARVGHILPSRDRSVAWDEPVVDEFENLLGLARLGNPEAWAELYEELAGPVLGYLRLRGAAEPEDLLSEVFLHMVRGLHAFVGDRQQFRSWVFTIAHRRLIDERRARGKRPIELREDLETTLLAEDPATEVIDRLTDEEIVGLLSTLTPEQRDVLLLRVLAGFTIDEIARVVGKSPGAVKALQRRGLFALQETLSAQ